MQDSDNNNSDEDEYCRSESNSNDDNNPGGEASSNDNILAFIYDEKLRGQLRQTQEAPKTRRLEMDFYF